MFSFCQSACAGVNSFSEACRRGWGYVSRCSGHLRSPGSLPCSPEHNTSLFYFMSRCVKYQPTITCLYMVFYGGCSTLMKRNVFLNTAGLCCYQCVLTFCFHLVHRMETTVEIVFWFPVMSRSFNSCHDHVTNKGLHTPYRPKQL